MNPTGIANALERIRSSVNAIVTAQQEARSIIQELQAFNQAGATLPGPALCGVWADKLIRVNALLSRSRELLTGYNGE